MKEIDEVVAAYMEQLRNPALTNVFLWFTYIGSKYVEFPLLIGIVAYMRITCKNGIISSVLLLNLLLVRWLNSFFKESFGRERPVHKPLIDVGGLSFPSGHAMITASFYGLLVYFCWRRFAEKGSSVGARITAAIGILVIQMIGISRIYLGVHYFSDVVGGFAAGAALLSLTVVCYNFLIGETAKQREGHPGD
ncbi:phosphatase PAP2 family protein [Pseudalkalibacillus caeni]|uniref:phosphatase PAP2 family protein n=1 Tax=Exobacillus caeni TaxID=2574798 RepID=UPI0014850DD2|nr:phosphatase PAP2 family protein [Pseudalkalibacillus caeni]